MNTLADFRITRTFKAGTGENGSGRNKTGRSGDDLKVFVPIGTLIHDIDTDEVICDLTEEGQSQKVAQGGYGGFGNPHFKSSINRAPRKITKGTPGEVRNLNLELKVLADVGLLGMPNAGKSTLIASMSHAKPRIADYPFTTLYPNLGVVRVGRLHSFVMADIPGLIEGASEGAGLGIQFLKHLQRTKLLLHIVDIAPIDQSINPADGIKTIVKELANFSDDLIKKKRWLIINKIDLMPKKDRKLVKERLLKELNWEGPVFEVSAATGEGTDKLGKAVILEIDKSLLEI
jgi:GTP-binding protein